MESRSAGAMLAAQGAARRLLLVLAMGLLTLSSCATGTDEADNASPSRAVEAQRGTTTTERQAVTTTSVASEASTTGVPPRVQFVFEEGVPQQDRAQIQQGIELAQSYVSPRVAPLARSFVVRGYSSQVDGNLARVYGPDSMMEINTANPDWVRETRAFQRIKIVVHEYFHVIQDQLSGPIDQLPVWLAEGTAEFIGYAAVIESGLITRPQALAANRLTNGIGNLVRAPRLEELESRDQWQSSLSTGEIYPLGYAVAERLVDSRGLEALTAYFTGLRTSRDDWRPLFERTFGKTADAFYAEVSQLRG